MTGKENIIRTIARDSPSWIPSRYDGSLTFLKPDTRVRPPEGGIDDWGTTWIPTNTPEGSCPDGNPAVDIAAADRLRMPTTDFQRVTESLRRQVNSLKETDTLVIGTSELTLFERASLLLGREEFLVATSVEPNAVGRLLGLVSDYQQQLIESMLRAGVSGIRFTDDWGMQSSLLISPERWRQLIKPHLERLYRVVRKHGGLVFQHSCGNLEEIVPDLIDIGVDVLDPCQPAANDIFGWKKRYGSRLSFMGGLDTQGYLSFGDAAHVKERVTEVVRIMSRGGGYIAAASHSITIPQENFQAMLDALAEVNAGESVSRTREG